MSSHYRVALPWEGHVPLAPTAEFESPSDFLVKYLNRRFCSFYDNALVSLTEHDPDQFLLFNFFTERPIVVEELEKIYYSFEHFGASRLELFSSGLLNWRNQQYSKKLEWTEIFQKPHPKLAKLGHEVLEERKLLLIDYLYSNVLLRVLSEYRQDTPLSPALSEQIEDHCFDFWRKMSVKTKIPDLENKKIIADLFSSVIGVLSSTRLDHVSRKLFRELGSPEEVHTKDLVTLTPLCQGLRFLKLSYTSPESLSVSMQFVSKLSQFFDAKHKKIFPELKLALCDLLASSITPLIETPQSSSMDFNVWNSCIHDMVSKVVLFEKGQRSSPTTQILKAALISVGGPTLFGEHINPLLETLFKTVKPGDKQRINSLEAIYRILLALFSQGFDDALVSKVCVKLSREILPPQKKTHDPLEGSVDILVDITTIIAISKPEFAVQHFIIPLLRGDKVFPERLIVGLLSANAILSRKEALYTGQLAGSSGAETAPPLSCRDSQDSWSGNLTSMKVAPGEPSEQQKGTLGKSFRKATLIRKSASSGMMRDPSETTAVELLHMNVPPALERILPLVQKEVGSFTQAYGPDVIPTNKAPLLELVRVLLVSLVHHFPSKIPSAEVMYQVSSYAIHSHDAVRAAACELLDRLLVIRPNIRPVLVNQFTRFCVSLPQSNKGLMLRCLDRLMGFIQTWIGLINSGSALVEEMRPVILQSGLTPSRLEMNDFEAAMLFLLCSNSPEMRVASLSLLRQATALCSSLPTSMYPMGTRVTEALQDCSSLALKSMFSDRLAMTSQDGEQIDFHAVITDIGGAPQEEAEQAPMPISTSASLGTSSSASSSDVAGTSSAPLPATPSADIVPHADLGEDELFIGTDDAFDKEGLAHLTLDVVVRSRRSNPPFWRRCLGQLLFLVSRPCPEACFGAYSLIFPQLELQRAVLDSLKANAASSATYSTFKTYVVAACALSGSAVLDSKNGPDRLFKYFLALLPQDLYLEPVLLGMTFLTPLVFEQALTVLSSYDAELVKGKRRKQPLRVALGHIYRIIAVMLRANDATELQVRLLRAWVQSTQAYIEQNDESAALHWLKYDLLTALPSILEVLNTNPQLCAVGDALQMRAALYPFLENISKCLVNLSTPDRRQIEELTLKLKTPEERANAASQIERQFRMIFHAASKSISWVLLGLPFHLSSDLSNSPIFAWVDTSFTSPESVIQGIGQQALLHYARGDITNPSLLTACIKKTYNSDRRVALNYFLVLSELIRVHNLNALPRSIEILNLCLLKQGDAVSLPARDSALLLFRFLSKALWPTSASIPLCRTPNLPNSISHMQHQLSDRLASEHPGLTLALLTEVMDKLALLDSPSQVCMIGYASLWAKNLDFLQMEDRDVSRVLAYFIVITIRHGQKMPSLVAQIWSLVGARSTNIPRTLSFLMNVCISSQNPHILDFSSQIVLTLARTAIDTTFQAIYSNFLFDFQNHLPSEFDELRSHNTTDPNSWSLSELVPPIPYRLPYLRAHISILWLRDIVIEYPAQSSDLPLLPRLFHCIILTLDYDNPISCAPARQLLYNLCYACTLNVQLTATQSQSLAQLESLLLDGSPDSGLWVREDILPVVDAPPLPSAKILSDTVRLIVSCLHHIAPTLIETWGAEALDWIKPTVPWTFHYALRSMQIYRALQPRISASASMLLLQRLFFCFSIPPPPPSLKVPVTHRDTIPIIMEIFGTLTDVLSYSSVADLAQLPHLWWAANALLNSEQPAVFYAIVKFLCALINKLDLADPTVTQPMLASFPGTTWSPPYSGILSPLIKGLVNPDEKIYRVCRSLITGLLSKPGPLLDVDPLRLRLLMLLSLLPQLLQYYCRVDSVSLSSQLAALLQSHPASAPVAAVLTQYAQVKFSTSTAFLSELAPAVSAAFFPRYEMVTFSLLVEWAERGASSAITPSILDMLAHLLRHVQLESSLLRAQGVALCSSLFKHFDGPLWKKPVEITEPFMASLDPSRMEIAHSKRIDVVNRLRDLSSIPSSWSSPDANLATIAASLTAIMTRSDPLNCDSSSDSLPSPRHHKSSKKSKPGKKSKGEKVPRSSSRRHVDEDVVKTPPPRRTRNDK